MSHHAHGTNKVYGHASRTRGMETGTAAKHSLYYELHPEMRRPPRPTLRNRRMTDDERKAAIAEDLRTHGNATAAQIARRLGIDVTSVTPLLRSGIDGVVVIERKASERSSRIAKIWGIK